jgi:hypothetical protein
MKRREFLAAGGAGLAALTTANALVANPIPIVKQYIEVRKYTVKDADKRKLLVETLDKALLPALNRQGIAPAGVFVPLEKEAAYALNVFVVFPHQMPMENITSVNTKLLADAEYRKAAAPIFETNSKDPVYTACETYLLNSFPSMPALETPQLGATKTPLHTMPDRVFEWRLYRSFNIERNAAKIKMFDEGGELPVFREVGLNPIFFGDVLAGNKLPALMYMVGCPSLEAHAEAWRLFGQHPKWREIRNLPEYADTATEIDKVVLKPSPGSGI